MSLRSNSISLLLGRHRGRPAFICGGAPSLVEDIKSAPANAIYISANEHGSKLRHCDYIVCCDNVELKLRPFKTPIISHRAFADYRLFNKPATNSGAIGVWAAWALGCSPIVIGGVAHYMNGTYWHNQKAFSSGLNAKPEYHRAQWRKLLADMPNQIIRVVSGPLNDLVKPYLPDESIDYHFDLDEVRKKASGIFVRFLREPTGVSRARGRYHIGDIAEVSPSEYKEYNFGGYIQKVPPEAMLQPIQPSGWLSVRGGSGLGDSIYLRPIVEHLKKQDKTIQVLTNYPEVFRGLKIYTDKFRKHPVDICAHYSPSKSREDTNQWQDSRIAAGIVDDIPLTFSWPIKNQAIIDDVKARAHGKKIVLLHGGRVPMGRVDSFGREILPEKKAFDIVLGQFQDCFIVKVGRRNDVLYPLDAHYDLSGRTSVAELFDLFSACDMVIGQCSFIIPLAEGLDKPLLCVWSQKGLVSNTRFVKTITPQKIFSKLSSKFVIDSWSSEQIKNGCATFRKI